jgi:POT family proton-dependent oligopeptide transporter
MTAEASKMAARMEIASSGQPAWRTERFGHPIGLPVLFSVEMWERFSFYGMRSILVLYLRSELLPSAAFDECVGAGVVKSLVGGSPTTPGEVQRAASTIYGLYTGFNYLTPLIGGYAADKWLGKKLCVASGLAVMGIGHFLMVVPSLFFVGLVLIVCGSGLFKPNMSVQLGGLYPAGDSRRDRAFSIFYMGVNLGAFFSPLVVGTIGDPSVLGYRVGFSIAGFGMCAGLLTYCSLGRYLPPADLATTGPAAGEEASDADEGGSGGSVVDKADAQKRLFALLLVCVTLVPYTIAYEQQGNTIQIFFDDHVDRSLPTVAGLFGLGSDWRIPSAWLQAVVRTPLTHSTHTAVRSSHLYRRLVCNLHTPIGLPCVYLSRRLSSCAPH